MIQIDEDQKLVVKWLESSEGERWSHGFHKTTGNQTDLLSLKECDEYNEKKVWVWRCGSNTYASLDDNWEQYI